MAESRIFFQDNPWPRGHLIEVFEWTARVIDGVVWFYFHLESEEYDAEESFDADDDELISMQDDDYDQDDEIDLDDTYDEASWENPGTWTNYRRATISATQWDGVGFPVCKLEEFSLDNLDGSELEVDPDPDECEDEDRWAFRVYLWGHDSVAQHHIRFNRVGQTERFNIEWDGRIALTYTGDVDYDYEFKAEINDVQVPSFS